MLDRFPDGLRDFVGLSQSASDMAMTVSYDDEGAETEPPSAFHDLCHPADVYDSVRQLQCA